MNTFQVRVYVATEWSFLTQADHFEDFTFTSQKSLEEFSLSLSQTGFQVEGKKRWIMPAAILEVKQV